MNRLTKEKRARIVAALVEGNSIRATCRMTDTAKGTALKLLTDLGAACWDYHDRTVRHLATRRVQCDEIWEFCRAKSKNVPKEHAGEWGYGDVWTWVAIDAPTKLVPSWAVGRRDGFTASALIRDLADRLSSRVQLTTDGHKVYLEAVEGAFGAAIDYVNSIGKERIAAHEHALVTYAQDRLREINSLRILGTAKNKGAIVSFDMKGAHAHDIATVIDRSGVAVRAGTHCVMPLLERFNVTATCRASFGMYNTRDEVDALAQALLKARDLFA